MDPILEKIMANAKLIKLLTLLYQSNGMDIKIPQDKLIGDWENAKPGDKVIVTFSNPFRIEHGFLLSLPGVEGSIIQIPESSEHEGQQLWVVLKYLALFAETLELEPRL